MPLALAQFAGLFGGGTGAAPPGPVTQTAASGPITIGARVLGRGASAGATSATAAGPGAAVTPGAGAFAPDRTGLYLLAGVAGVALLLVLLNRPRA